MEHFLSHPPSRKLLKKIFLDGFRRDRRPSEMNCVAHMILDMEDPAAVTAVALDYLIDTALLQNSSQRGFTRGLL